MTGGERRLATALQSKLEDDYLLWYDVPIGGSGFHPDFVILHPRRGLLVLEVKDWLLDNICSIDKTRVTLLTNRGVKIVTNPFEQARAYAQAIANLLERDPQLVEPEGAAHRGRLIFPWSYGVVLSRIARRQFESTNLGEVLPPSRVICQDELTAAVDAEQFQERLWQMFPWAFGRVLSLPQIDRIRWHLFPEIRIEQGDLFAAGDPAEALPDILRLMDLQQEQLARSLGDGHRVIHGVAGSGKTMILVYRCLHLARVLAKPILILCYNKALASHLTELLRDKGIGDRVQVRNFHGWCRDQLVHYHVPLPPEQDRDAYVAALVDRLADAVERSQVPAGQYGAVLIDEGHDFRPEWLTLAARMVDPDTRSLLLLYDDAQNIYGSHRRRFSFRSVGIDAQGRTTILRLNYRNTAEVLEVAYTFAKDLLSPSEADDDGVPLLAPESADRHGPPPKIIRRPTFKQELQYIVEQFRALKADGASWADMAVVYRSRFMGEAAVSALRMAGIPVNWLVGRARRAPQAAERDAVTIVTFHSSKGLEFPIVAIPGVGYLPYANDDLAEEVRLAYVAMTRAMDRLVMTYHRESAFVRRIAETGAAMAA
ncbi:MAG: 3'-5' exonuclease [Chromatiaceae bacterium]